MRAEAIQTSINYVNGQSFSDGNIVIGTSNDYVAVSWNNTENNENQLTVLTVRDAQTLLVLLGEALSKVL